MNTLSFDTNAVITLCRRHDVAKLGVFGSVARGESDAESDIDFLVSFSKPKSLLELISLERQLSTVLGKPVDVLTEAAISPYLRDRIMRETRTLYETG